jgi:hypothetical protein
VLPKAKKLVTVIPTLVTGIFMLCWVLLMCMFYCYDFSGARVQYQGLGVLRNTSLRLWQEPKIQ